MFLSNPEYSEIKRKYGHQKNVLPRFLTSQEDIDWMFFTTLNANERPDNDSSLAAN